MLVELYVKDLAVIDYRAMQAIPEERFAIISDGEK